MQKGDFQPESCVLWEEKGKVFQIFSIYSAACNRENLILASSKVKLHQLLIINVLVWNESSQ